MTEERTIMKKGLAFPLVYSFFLFYASLGVAQEAFFAQASRKKMGQQCEKILSSPCLKGARIGIKILSLPAQEVIFEKNAHDLLIPASNMKVITSAAALHLLKPEYTFKIAFYHDGQMDNGVLKGNLYIKGYGAPDLVGERIWIMLRELIEYGLMSVEGDLVGDDSYFDLLERPRSWPSPVNDDPYEAPISALACNFSSVQVIIRPGKGHGRPIVHLFPFSDYVKIINEGETKGYKESLSLKRIYVEGENRILVQGSIPPQTRLYSEYKSIEKPTYYTLYSVREILRYLGVTIHGKIRKGTVPADAKEIFTYHTQPLSKIIYDMNKKSNNFMAEMILKTLGAEIIGPPGTTEKGIDVLKLFMNHIVQDHSKMILKDGSGLSKKNRLSASSLINVLRFMDDQFGEGYDFAASLPVGGADGTLRNRFTDGSIARSVRGKTGFLNGVVTLSGFIKNESGQRFAFAILINGSACDALATQKVIDRLCQVIIHP